MAKSLRRAGSKLPTRPADARRPLLARILDTPQLAQVVPRLRPDVLHRVIEKCGLEDSGELVVLATPAQLSAVFDLDLWKADQPGFDEHFDPDRFGLWLEVLMDAGGEAGVQTVAGMDARLVSVALAQHVRVYDGAAGMRLAEDAHSFEIGGYVVVASRSSSWDAIVATLMALHASHEAYFHRVMRASRDLSDSAAELDGLDDLLTASEQALFDMSIDRQRRREEQGYVTPAEARAFLRMAREGPQAANGALPADPVTRAYFRAIELTEPDAPGEERSEQAVAAVVEVLIEAGVLPEAPRALLEAPKGGAPKLARMRALMQCASARDRIAYATRTQELAYLVNTMAVGCSVQERALTVDEASEAAVAVCNFGLENAPAASLADDFLVGHDLVSVFQIGWAALHTNVCMYAAEKLIGVLTQLRFEDRETQAGINALRKELKKHCRAGEPWLALGALDVIESLDMPAWAALLALIAECPVIHAGMRASHDHSRAVSATAFEFVSENSQIEAVHEFMRALPDMLGP